MPDGVVRILQLFARPPDFQTGRAAEILRRHAGPDFTVEARVVGRGGDYRHLPAAIVGLRRDRRLFDVVQTWDDGALTAAAFAGARRILHSPQRPFGTRGVRWLRAVAGHRDVQIVCPAATQRRICGEYGIPIDRCHLIRPGVDFGRVRRKRDPALRAALGLADDDIVLLLPGESTLPAAHERGVWAGSILGIIDPRYKILLWGRGPRAERAAKLGTQLGQADLVTVAERKLGRVIEFEALLNAADMALNPATGPVATLALATCMAAGLPIVSSVTYTTAELLEDRHTAFIARKGSPRFLAKRALELLEDPSAGASISDVARTEAYEYLSMTRFVSQYRQVWKQIAEGRPVEVAEVAPGAGSRFHGRGGVS